MRRWIGLLCAFVGLLPLAARAQETPRAALRELVEPSLASIEINELRCGETCSFIGLPLEAEVGASASCLRNVVPSLVSFKKQVRRGISVRYRLTDLRTHAVLFHRGVLLVPTSSNQARVVDLCPPRALKMAPLDTEISVELVEGMTGETLEANIDLLPCDVPMHDDDAPDLMCSDPTESRAASHNRTFLGGNAYEAPSEASKLISSNFSFTPVVVVGDAPVEGWWTVEIYGRTGYVRAQDLSGMGSSQQASGLATGGVFNGPAVGRAIELLERDKTGPSPFRPESAGYVRAAIKSVPTGAELMLDGSSLDRRTNDVLRMSPGVLRRLRLRTGRREISATTCTFRLDPARDIDVEVACALVGPMPRANHPPPPPPPPPPRSMP